MYNDFTIVGDPHASLKNLDKINKLTSEVECLGLPTIWLGDMLDTKEVIRGKCLNTWIEYFQSSKLQHIVIVGNHDWFNLECKAHSLESLKLLNNVIVVDELTVYNKMYFLPYIHDQDKLNVELEKIPKDSIVFGHFEIKDFDFGNGRMCDNGMSATSLVKYERVISGHFHKYQQKGNFTYLGTPFSQSFGESNQKKFLAKYTIDTNMVNLIETQFPKHLTYTINCDKTQSIALVNDPKDYVRVVLSGSQENIDKAKAYNTINNEVKVIEKSTDEFDNQIIIDDTSDNLSQFSEWATNIQQLDKETIKLGLQILGVASGR